MLLIFVIVLIVTGLAILFSIYSIFIPFSDSFKDISDYNIAYYSAISSIERGGLVLKYRWPWFVWSGWWLGIANIFGKASDTLSGLKIWSTIYNGLLRDINSRTYRIPNFWEWNVDIDFLMSGEALDYNKTDYRLIETFLLSIDNTSSGDYYKLTWSNREHYGWTSISWQFRLPPKIFSGFGKVCDSDEWDIDVCDPDLDWLYDDIIIDWSIKWYHNWVQFFLMPSQSVARYGTERFIEDWDTTIRESNINTWSLIVFWNNYNIFDPSNSYPGTQNVVSNDTSISGKTFKDIFEDSQFTWLQVKFAFVNFLRSLGGDIYPFLEYFFEFNSPVADKFYTIKWIWRKGDYDIKIIVKKPTFKDTVAGSFTVIF